MAPMTAAVAASAPATRPGHSQARALTPEPLATTTTTTTNTTTQVFVRVPCGRTIAVALPSAADNALDTLQRLIAVKTNIPAFEQRLTYCSRPLTHASVRALPPHATLQLSLQLPGGGVQGFMALLESESARADKRLIHFARGDSVDPSRNTLVVDGSALQAQFRTVLDSPQPRAVRSAERRQRMYHNTRILCAALRARGIVLHVVFDGAVEPGSEKTVVGRQIDSFQRGLQAIGTTGAFRQALREELPSEHIHQARAGADDLVYALACDLDSSLLGIITSDTDFFVLGRHNIVLVQELPLHDILAEGRLDHLYLWSANQVWNLAAGHPVDTDIRQRAIFACILGNDRTKDMRKALEDKDFSPKRTARSIFDPSCRAGPIPAGSPLTSADLLAAWTRWLKALLPVKCVWQDEHTQRFYTAVQTYIDTVEAGARDIAELVYVHDDGVLSRSQQCFLDRVPSLARRIVPILTRGQLGGRPSALESALLGARFQTLLQAGPAAAAPLFIHVPAQNKVLKVESGAESAPTQWLSESAYTDGPNSVTVETLHDPHSLLPSHAWDMLNGPLTTVSALAAGLLAFLREHDDAFLHPHDSRTNCASLVAAMVFFFRLDELDDDSDAYAVPARIKQIMAESANLLFAPDDRRRPDADRAVRQQQQERLDGRAAPALSAGRLTPKDWDEVDDPAAKRRVQGTTTFNLLRSMRRGSADAKPREHQEEYLGLLYTYLPESSPDDDSDISEGPESGDEAEAAAGAAAEVRPLQLLYSTPTGSGKTFSALLGFMRVIEQRQGKILLYCTPNQMVLKNIGLLCEAHDLVYWIATTVGVDVYNVQRPFSIRTDAKKAAAGAAKTKSSARGKQGCMGRMLSSAFNSGEYLRDRGGGRPQVIVADVEAAKAVLDSHFYDSKDLVLFYDEPDASLRPIFERVVRHPNGPQILVLASATLPGSWDDAEDWLRTARKREVDKKVIFVAPLELPMCRLGFVDAASRSLQRVGLLHSFQDAEHARACFAQLSRQEQVLLMRFVSTGPREERGEKLAIRLANITDQNFERFRANSGHDALRFDPGAMKKGLADACKSVGGGVTLMAASDVVAAAEALLGLTPTELAAEAHALRRSLEAKLRESRINVAREQQLYLVDLQHQQNDGDRRARSSRKRGDRAAAVGGMDAPDVSVSVRFGLIMLSGDDADELLEGSDLELVSIKHRIFFSADDYVSPLMKRAFAQVALHTPEGVLLSPRYAGTVLVVDINGIYGLDCRGIRQVALDSSLEASLSASQVVQFLGRLRVEGLATFMSWSALNRAILGETWVREQEQAGHQPPAPHVEPQLSLPELVAEQFEANHEQLKAAISDRGAFTRVGGKLLGVLRKHKDYHVAKVVKILVHNILEPGADRDRDRERVKVVFLTMLHATASSAKEVRPAHKWSADIEKKSLLDLLKKRAEAWILSGRADVGKVVYNGLCLFYNADVLSDEVFQAWYAVLDRRDFSDIAIYEGFEEFANAD